MEEVRFIESCSITCVESPSRLLRKKLFACCFLVVNDTNKNEYKKAQKGWWNTYQVERHFGELAVLLYSDMPE